MAEGFPVAPLGLADWPADRSVTGAGFGENAAVVDLILEFGSSAVDEPLVVVTTSLRPLVDTAALNAWREMRYRSGLDDRIPFPKDRPPDEPIPLLVEG